MIAKKFDDQKGFEIALEEAKKGLKEGGIPIGAALVRSDGKVLGRGHNMRVQRNSAILHGEMAALEDAGRLNVSEYNDCTLYTTLSPCFMCSGAALFYGIKRIVMGENVTTIGPEDLLREKGIELINYDDSECRELMESFIKLQPKCWHEDSAQD